MEKMEFKDGDLISVIIPVYNVQECLERCLESVIDNTYKNLEIICIDDGSTDNCPDILEKYRQLDSRITLISKENGGLSSARNKGLEACTGDYISFIDSDDWIHRDYFAILAEIQKKNDFDIVVCGHVRTKELDALEFDIDRAKIKYSSLNRKEYIASRKTKNYVWGKLYKRQIIENLRFNEEEKVEDAEMKSIIAMDCLKRSLNSRYGFMVAGNRRKAKESSQMAKQCVKYVANHRWMWKVFTYWPFAYRLFRIVDDPTMLQWERSLRG